MARPLRIEYEGAFYHVTSRGNERRKVFYAKADYEKFIFYLRDAQGKYGYLLHCYVLMTNHYHLLIETPHGNITKVMHYINGCYTSYINRRRKRSGHLFQGRYKAVLIDRDSYILELSRYVHLNPVRAKLVAKPQDYPHSSYRSYVLENKDDLIHHDLILEMISKDGKDAAKKYRGFVEGAIGEKLKNPLKKVYGGAILGGQVFIKEALRRLKDEVLQKEETSNRKQLLARHGSDHVIDTISAHFKVSRDDVFANSRGYRNLAIYLMKRFTGMTNRQIGELFGSLSYSAVAKAHQRLSTKLRNDKSLRKTIEDIVKDMSLVKG